MHAPDANVTLARPSEEEEEDAKQRDDTNRTASNPVFGVKSWRNRTPPRWTWKSRVRGKLQRKTDARFAPLERRVKCTITFSIFDTNVKFLATTWVLKLEFVGTQLNQGGRHE